MAISKFNKTRTQCSSKNLAEWRTRPLQAMGGSPDDVSEELVT